jgi:hypothetical protein
MMRATQAQILSLDNDVCYASVLIRQQHCH